MPLHEATQRVMEITGESLNSQKTLDVTLNRREGAMTCQASFWILEMFVCN